MVAARDSQVGGGPGTLSVRCYAFGGGRSWEAICTDFDIGVSGESLSGVQKSLEICIEMYLEEVAEASPEDRRYLLARRSPWFVRAKLGCLAWISRLRAGVGAFREFTLQPHVPALR